MSTIAATPRWRSLAGVFLLFLGIYGVFSASPQLPTATPSQGPPPAMQTLEFNKDIRPILSEYCLACHGLDSNARVGDLRLDERDSAISCGSIIPHHPEQSDLIARLLLPEADSGHMPPTKVHKKLSRQQIETLKTWIAQGANYQQHWAYLPIQKKPFPSVKNRHLIRNPIDVFVLKEMQQRGFQPAPEADRWTLARRLSLDLTGLPPKPEDLDAFVHDTSSNYYEAYVNKLLSSPHWGEHRAHYWLDAARYADTHGYHADNFREIWSYRDWVIQAFNQNMHFDQFTLEQLAGDLLPNPTLEQLVATGFNRCHMTTSESGAIEQEYDVLYTRDCTETVAQTWLGLTMNCAVCHDHKGDPISQKEFYAMSAFFNNTVRTVFDHNLKGIPPTIPFIPREDREAYQGFEAKAKASLDHVNLLRSHSIKRFQDWCKTVTPSDVAPSKEGLRFVASFADNTKDEIRWEAGTSWDTQPLPTQARWVLGPQKETAALAIYSNVATATFPPEIGNFELDTPFSCATWIRCSAPTPTGAILAKMDDSSRLRGWDVCLENRRLTLHLLHNGVESGLTATVPNPIEPIQWNHIVVSYDGSRTAAGLTCYLNGVRQELNFTINGVKVAETNRTQKLEGSIRCETPFALARRSSPGSGQWYIEFHDLRLYNRALDEDDANELYATITATLSSAKKPEARVLADLNALFLWWERHFDRPSFLASQEYLAYLETAKTCFPRRTIAHICQEKPTPAQAYILHRGDYDKRMEVVSPDTPAIRTNAGRGQEATTRRGLSIQSQAEFGRTGGLDHVMQ